MRNNRRNRGTELGVLLLVSHLINNNEWIPPVTLGSVVIQILIYLKILILPFAPKEYCISGANVLYKKKYLLLLTSALEHGDDMHLYYNMTSFIIKGRYLEKKYGPVNFALLLISLIFLSSGFYVVTSYAFYVYYDQEYSQLVECAVGFSGVLFALKTILTREKPSERYSTMGFSLPAWSAAWAELILISILVPNASFKGHLAGILAGLLYTDTTVGSVLDTLFHIISGRKVYHNFQRKLSFKIPGASYFSSTSHSRPQSSYSNSFSSQRSGQPPPYGFVFGNTRNGAPDNDWEYEYNPR